MLVVKKVRVSGFTLVELSIVLVILGLITGGIVAGQGLIRAAQLRSIASEVEHFNNAHFQFRDQYFALAGDMENATEFWGAESGSPATCRDTESTGKETCNGNGDGIIMWTNWCSDQESHEHFRYWQHLANAGYVDGQYAGVGRDSDGTVDNNGAANGYNIPTSKLDNAGYFVWSTSPLTNLINPCSQTQAVMLFNRRGILLNLGGEVAGEINAAPVLTPKEAWNIDSKIDDGMPSTGSVAHWSQAGYYGLLLALGETATVCVDGNTSGTAVYDLDREELSCVLTFFLEE